MLDRHQAGLDRIPREPLLGRSDPWSVIGARTRRRQRPLCRFWTPGLTSRIRTRMILGSCAFRCCLCRVVVANRFSPHCPHHNEHLIELLKQLEAIALFVASLIGGTVYLMVQAASSSAGELADAQSSAPMPSVPLMISEGTVFANCRLVGFASIRRTRAD